MRSSTLVSIAVFCAFFLALPAAFADPRRGINVGTNPSGGDVVYNGLVLAPWNFEQETYVVGSDLVQFNFYISLNDTLPGAQGLLPSQDFSVSTQSSNTSNALVMAQIVGSSRVSVGYENQKLVQVTFTCVHTSYTILQLQVNFQLFDPLDIFFNKSCAVLEPRHFFSMSNNLTLNSNVVRDGVVHEGFFLGVDAKTTKTVFFVYMEPATGTQYFNVSQLLTDELQVVANVTYDPTDQIAPDLEDGYSLLTISYNCVGPGGRSDVSLLIDIPGWKSIELGYTKDCPFPPSPPHPDNGGGGGGWSKAGIAFFVLFIIGTVACLAGCAYNRLQLRKDGIDIIPGARSFANCVEKAKASTAGGYTQQTNTNDTLMHSDYQSNL